MVNDVTDAIFGKAAEKAVSVRTRSKQLQYWKKCQGRLPNGGFCPIHTQDFGWVTTGPVMSPTTAIEYTEFQTSKHMTPLPQYGQYIVGLVEGQDYNLSDQAQRFRAIVDKGGIREFPLDQMIAYNWHRIEVMRNLIPELGNVVDIKCENGCVNRLFSNQNDYETHCQVVHQDAEAPRAIAREMTKVLEMQGTGYSAEQLTQILAAAMKMAKQDESVK